MSVAPLTHGGTLAAMQRKDTPRARVAHFIMRSHLIRSGLPVFWTFIISERLALFALFLHLAFVLKPIVAIVIAKMQKHDDRPFPFMDLPPELRYTVYNNLLEDPHFPAPKPCVAKRNTSWIAGLTQKQESAVAHQSNFLFLANKQIYAEYMDLMCKKTTFQLSVTPDNYAPPSADENEKRLWNISPHVLKRMRKCVLKLVTTSTMLGVSDPRNMRPEEWALAHQMRRELSAIENITSLDLHVKAIGDPLWNPLWVWYHATQSLKMMGYTATGESASGPKFTSITFSLDMWSPGENYLKRDPANGNQWAWWCLKGHCVGPVGGGDLTVREFCNKLYDCSTCQPQDSDDEDEDA